MLTPLTAATASQVISRSTPLRTSDASKVTLASSDPDLSDASPFRPTSESAAIARAAHVQDPAARLKRMQLAQAVDSNPFSSVRQPSNLTSQEKKTWDAITKGVHWETRGSFGGRPSLVSFLHDPTGQKGRQRLIEDARNDDADRYQYSMRPDYGQGKLSIFAPDGEFTLERGSPKYDAFMELYERALKHSPVQSSRG